MALSMGALWKMKMRKEIEGKRKRKKNIENRLVVKRAQ